MARPATGSPKWNETEKRWEARVSMPGGRVPVPMPTIPACLVAPNAPRAKCECASCRQARRVAKVISDAMRASALRAETRSETTDDPSRVSP